MAKNRKLSVLLSLVEGCVPAFSIFAGHQYLDYGKCGLRATHVPWNQMYLISWSYNVNKVVAFAYRLISAVLKNTVAYSEKNEGNKMQVEAIWKMGPTKVESKNEDSTAGSTNIAEDSAQYALLFAYPRLFDS